MSLKLIVDNTQVIKDEEALKVYVQRVISGEIESDPEKTTEFFYSETFKMITPEMVRDLIKNGTIIVLPIPKVA